MDNVIYVKVRNERRESEALQIGNLRVLAPGEQHHAPARGARRGDRPWGSSAKALMRQLVAEQSLRRAQGFARGHCDVRTTPTPSQSAPVTGLSVFPVGSRMPKWLSMRASNVAWAWPDVVSPTIVARLSACRSYANSSPAERVCADVST